jgi:hypothetical protein
MPRKKKLVNKVAKKKMDGKCYFCPVNDYSWLHLHRILPGEDGGIYTDFNTITVCANCHERIHDGQIKIDRKYFSTSGKWVLHYFENGEEFWQ